MKQRTDQPLSGEDQSTSEFSPDFVRVLVALTITTLLFVFVLERGIFNLHGLTWKIHSFFYPWVVAGGQTIGNGLQEFSGHVPAPLSLSERIAALLSLIIGFMIGPSLFFFGWYYRRKERTDKPRRFELKGSGVIFTIGAILTFATAIPAIPIAFIRANVEGNLRSAQAIQSNKDAIINEMSVLANSAFQYRVLPHRLGGGEGSYEGYVLRTGLSDTENARYSVMITVDGMTFKATSVRYPSSTVRCAIDQEGKFIPGEWHYTGEFE